MVDNKININKASIHIRNKTEILSSRGGSAPNKSKGVPIKSLCILPFSQMIIRPDGKVSLCCNDALGQYTLGDVSNNKIVDIWYGATSNEYRKKILKGRQQIEICNVCDTLFTPLPFERIDN